MMKKGLLLFLAAACSLQAAVVAENFQQAKTLVGKNGYILFAYADGWDRYSRNVSEKLMNDAGLQRAAGDAVLLRYPVRQAPSQNERKAFSEVWQGLKVPNADNYPALLLFDAKGRHYSTICGTFMTKARPKKVSGILTERFAAKQKQDELMEQANKAQGTERARLIGEACAITDIARPDKYVDLLKKADPNDESGMVRRFTFNPWGYVESKLKAEPAAVLEELDAKLAAPAYTDDQKQVFCTLAIGTLRRSSLPDVATRIQAYSEKLQQLGAKTVLGKSASVVRREWITSLSCEDGWSPSVLPSDQTPTELQGELPIAAPGIYTVTFRYRSGRHQLVVKAVELYDGDTKVAEDIHNGSAGVKHNRNTYDLKVEKPVSNPRILITFDMRQNKDSYGSISVFRQK